MRQRNHIGLGQISLQSFVRLIGLLLILSASRVEEAVGLNYKQHGADWSGLCMTGLKQSPINIVQSELVQTPSHDSFVRVKSLGTVHGGKMFITDELPHLEIEWGGFVSEPQMTVPATKGDGDIFAPVNGFMTSDQISHLMLKPLQFHFHTPSENQIDGKVFPGVVHVVSIVKDGESAFCDRKKAANGQGCPVVFSIFLDYPQEDNWNNSVHQFTNLLSAPWTPTSFEPRRLLKQLGKHNGLLLDHTIDLDLLLPKSGEYATWSGSLTTFPCTEDVLWVQFMQPIQVTTTQIAQLKFAVGFSEGPGCWKISDGRCLPPRPLSNNRLVQALNGRLVYKGIAY